MKERFMIGSNSGMLLLEVWVEIGDWRRNCGIQMLGNEIPFLRTRTSLSSTLIVPILLSSSYLPKNHVLERARSLIRLWGKLSEFKSCVRSGTGLRTILEPRIPRNSLQCDHSGDGTFSHHLSPRSKSSGHTESLGLITLKGCRNGDSTT